MADRQIVLDTETTGLEPAQGHRIIEIGCVELVNRRLTGNHYHQYINPEREIDAGALEVHGISNEFLADKPLFAAVVEEFLEYIEGAELIIHNAPFDVGFLDNELSLLSHKVKSISSICSVVDSLYLARQKHPGQKNSLDALCKRYMIDNSRRTLHGALLDSEILADVYLSMTGGQTALHLGGEGAESSGNMETVVSALNAVEPIDRNRAELPRVELSEEEKARHAELLDSIDRQAAEGSVWRRENVIAN